jgi:hypothetical protein
MTSEEIRPNSAPTTNGMMNLLNPHSLSSLRVLNDLNRGGGREEGCEEGGKRDERREGRGMRGGREEG